MSKKLVTGANGFVAKALCEHLCAQGIMVRGTVRDQSRPLIDGVERHITGSINGETDWHNALIDVDVVFHLASTVHRPGINDSNIYQTTIPEATLTLARQAANFGIKRFVYLSTSKVYGVESSTELLKETHRQNPETPYGVAKRAAEHSLQDLAEQTNLEVVIVRPPLVYGPGVRSNFTQLMKLVQKFPYLPFGCANNKRSFVGIDNLINFLVLCSKQPKAANQVFNISDDQDLSTRELCQMIAHLLQRKSKLLPVPKVLMHTALKLMGKEAMYNKLFESVRLDVTYAKTSLNWAPSFTVTQQFQNLFV